MRGLFGTFAAGRQGGAEVKTTDVSNLR